MVTEWSVCTFLSQFSFPEALDSDASDIIFRACTFEFLRNTSRMHAGKSVALARKADRKRFHERTSQMVGEILAIFRGYNCCVNLVSR